MNLVNELKWAFHNIGTLEFNFMNFDFLSQCSMIFISKPILMKQRLWSGGATKHRGSNLASHLATPGLIPSTKKDYAVPIKQVGHCFGYLTVWWLY